MGQAWRPSLGAAWKGLKQAEMRLEVRESWWGPQGACPSQMGTGWGLQSSCIPVVVGVKGADNCP